MMPLPIFMLEDDEGGNLEEHTNDASFESVEALFAVGFGGSAYEVQPTETDSPSFNSGTIAQRFFS